MLAFLVRRLIGAVLVLAVVSFVVFAIFILIPGGDPAERIAGRTATQQNIDNIRHSWGFDRPWYVQYWQMIKKTANGLRPGYDSTYGELRSFTNQTDVVDQIRQGIPATFSLVIGAGSNFPNRTELPADLVTRAQAVVVDQLAVARLESGDLIQAVGAGALAWERVTELGTVMAGGWKAPAEPGITLFESHGLALWDIAAASVVLPKAIEQGLGEEVGLF